MCCMNLSDHSKSIHKQLQWLEQQANQIQQNQGFFDGFLTSLFGNLPAWLNSLIIEILRICIVLLAVGIIICIFFSCLKKALSKMTKCGGMARLDRIACCRKSILNLAHGVLDRTRNLTNQLCG